MSSTSTAEETGSRLGGGGTVRSGQSLPEAVVGVWYAWAIAVVGALASAYFFLNRGVWENDAEIFYIIIFGGVAVIALVYGVYSVYDHLSSL